MPRASATAIASPARLSLVILGSHLRGQLLGRHEAVAHSGEVLDLAPVHLPAVTGAQPYSFFNLTLPETAESSSAAVLAGSAAEAVRVSISSLLVRLPGKSLSRSP